MTDDYLTVSVEDAVAALKKAAWRQPAGRCPYCDHVCVPEGEPMIHTFTAGGFGADWDLADAIAFVREATERTWVPNTWAHNLQATGGVSRGRRVMLFDVPVPPEVRRAARAARGILPITDVRADR